MKAIKHFKTITKHKFYVMKLCFRFGLYKQGLLHDLSKYTWSEFATGAKYYLGYKYWGKGIMSEAVKQICQYVFKNSDIERIFAAPFDYNPTSQRVLEKCGFEREGILRKNGFKNGEFHDMIMYSLIK